MNAVESFFETPCKQQKLIRRIDNHSMADIIMKLSYETWDTVFNNDNIDIKFNSF
jgi:hypothetical protein